MKYATRTNPPPTMLAMEYVGAECGGRSQSVSVRFLASVCKRKKEAGDVLLAWGRERGKGKKEKCFSYSTAREEYMS